MKNRLLSVLGLVVLAGFIEASQDLTSVNVDKWDKTQTYGEKGEDKKTFLVGLEFTNNDDRPVWIKVFNGEKTSPIVKIGETSGRFFRKEKERKKFIIDTNKWTYLAVWNFQPEGENVAEWEPYRFFTFTPGKTIYVTWDSSAKNQLRPTKGRFFGALSKTDSGLNLKNNVSQGDIRNSNRPFSGLVNETKRG